jgi:hypothetical protein
VKRLEFKCEAAVKFMPYEDFYWQRRSLTVLSKWFFDVFQSVSYSGPSIVTQSVAAFGSRLMYNPHLLGINTVYATQTKEATARSYAEAYTASAAPTLTNNFYASDYIATKALWDSSYLPEKIYETGNSSSLMNAASSYMTASFLATKKKTYKPSTSLALQNYFCEIENFYGVERSVLKSKKKPETTEGKFKLREKMQDSSHAVRNITLYVALDNEYMPTTNFDFIGPWPWYANLPYGGLGQHTGDVFDQATEYDGFEVSDTPNIMARSHLNVPDRRLLKITYVPASDTLEELGWGEFLASASYLTTSEGMVDYGGFTAVQSEHPMGMENNLVFNVDKDGSPFIGTKGENITALLDASSASFSITAMSGNYTTDVPGVATVSSYVSDYNAKKGTYLKIIDPQSISGSSRAYTYDGDISAAKLFGLSGAKRVGEIIEDKFLEEAVVVIPLIGEENCKHEPIPLEEGQVFSRLAFLQKTGQLRFEYFTNEQLEALTINRESDVADDLDHIDDLILAMEKFVFPPELDFLLSIRTASRNNRLTIRGGRVFTGSDSVAPYFATVFNFSKKLSRNERFALWQGHLPDSLSTSETVNQTISVPMEKVLGKGFKFENKVIRAMTFRAKFRAETNFDVYGSKKTDVEYDKKLDYDLSYNWPYDQCTILPLGKVSAKIYCREDEL